MANDAVAVGLEAVVEGARPDVPADLPPPTRRPRAFDDPRGWGRVGRYALLVAISFVVLFPIYTTVIAALKPGDKVLENPLLPDAFTLDVLRDAWSSGHLGRYLANSAVV